MGISRHHCKDRNFVYTILSGSISDTDLLEHVLALNAETKGIFGLRTLADCRNITDTSSLTIQGTTQSAIIEADKPGSLAAIVVPKDSPLILGISRAYQTFASERRSSMQIFTDVSAALSWLAADATDQSRLAAFIEKTTSEIIPKSDIA